MSSIFSRDEKLYYINITSEQSKDTGMAMILISLLAGIFLQQNVPYICAIVLCLVNMVCPILFKPVAWFWLGLSNVLGSIMSKILLLIVFIVLVMPVGLVRRFLFRKDSLQLRKWKKGIDSVFVSREHNFIAGDLENPY